MRSLSKLPVLLGLALVVVVVFGRQLGPGLVFVVAAVLLGGGWKALARGFRRGRKTRARNRRAARAAAHRADMAEVDARIRLRQAAERAEVKERARIATAAARQAGIRKARIDAGLDPDTGRPPGAPAPAKKAAPRKAAPKKSTP